MYAVYKKSKYSTIYDNQWWICRTEHTSIALWFIPCANQFLNIGKVIQYVCYGTCSHFILRSYFIFQFRRHQVRMHFTFKSCLTSCKIKHEYVVLKLPFMMHVCLCNRRTNYIWWQVSWQNKTKKKIVDRQQYMLLTSICYESGVLFKTL